MPVVFGIQFGFNKEKSRANAEKFLQQNKLQNAITEYEKILQVEPRDLTILNTVGDIYSRLGQNEKAIERFRVVAESYVADNLTLKAIALYKKITKLDPNALPAMEKLAELYRKQGLVGDARSMLLQAADAYTKSGQSKETLRLLKQLVLFDPENVQVIARTAELMITGGQKTEAKEMLTQTASTLVERRALEPAQKILDRLIALDRNNLRAQELRAQVTLELGDTEKAAELYEAIPDLDSRVDALRHLLTAWLKLDKLENAFPVARKLRSVHHDASGILQIAAALHRQNECLPLIALCNEFAVELLALDREGVLSYLHSSVSRVRTNSEALQSLYSLFQRVGETSMLAEVLELLAHACVQAGEIERARDAYKELIALEPENAAHIQAYRQVCARLDPSATPAPASEALPEAEPQSLEEFLTTSEPVLPTQSYPPELEELITAALSEAELYESFASKARSITVLEKALLSAPEDLRILRTLGMLYRQEGDPSKSANAYRTMQRVLENLGDTEAAEHYAKLTTSGETTTWEAKGSEFAARDFDIAQEENFGGTEEIDLSNEWESVWTDDAAAEPASQPAEPAPADVDDGSQLSDLLEEVHFCLAQKIWAEAEFAIARLAQACPGHPDLPELRAELLAKGPASSEPPAAASAPVEVIEVAAPASPPDFDLSATPQDTRFSVSPASGEPSLPPWSDPPNPGDTSIDDPSLCQPAAAAPTLGSLAADLDLELGDNFEPAQQPRRQPPPPAPAPAPVTLEPVAELFALPVPSPEPSVAATSFDLPEPAFALPELALPNLDEPLLAPPAPLTQPDLAQRDLAQPSLAQPTPVPLMAAATDAPPADSVPNVFGELLQDFERDLAPAQDTDDDPETHFSLGLAFRDMGLLDEAIGELQKVCRLAGSGLTPARAQQAYIWLATCFVEKSVPEASFKWFLRALESAPDEDSRTAVNYELASAYAAAGRKREALDHFLEVYGSNIDYRDVASRIRELRSAN